MRKDSQLNRILSEMTFYSNPDLVITEYKSRINFDGVDLKVLKKYQTLLLEIKWATEKVLRYPNYFVAFYPSDESIPHHEALEHHIHAYIEDLNILRNKLHKFLGVLKNDLKKVAINKDDVTKAMEFLTSEIYRVFNSVSSRRNPHNHGIGRLKDVDIVDVEFVELALNKDLPLRSMVKPEFIAELEARAASSFEKAKEKWIGMATKNTEQINGLVDETIERTKNFLYQMLNISSLDFFFEKSE